MMPMPRLLIVSLAAVLGGCVSYQSKNIDPVATAAQLDRRSLEDAGLRKFLTTPGQAAGGEWDLPRLTLAAFYFSPDLDVARAQWGTTRAGVRTAGQRPNPTLTDVAPTPELRKATGPPKSGKDLHSRRGRARQRAARDGK